MTNAAGVEISAADYLPYGSNRAGANITQTSYQFTDQELDSETGLYNYDARLYDPIVGQFISADNIVPDWYDPQSLNRYSYCLNNPLIYSDPSGHNAERLLLGWGTALAEPTPFGEIVMSAYTAMSISRSLLNAIDKFEAKSIGSKEKRAKDKQNTQDQKENRDQFGDMTEAHQDQKNQGAAELGDKLEGIKAEYPEQAAKKN